MMSVEYSEAMSNVEKLFRQIDNKVFTFDLMRKVAAQLDKTGTEEEANLSLDLYTTAVRHLCQSRIEVDIRTLGEFLPAFCGVFLNLSFNNWQHAMATFWDVPDLKITEKGIPPQPLPTLFSKFPNFAQEFVASQHFLYAIECYSDSIDGDFVWHCRYLSLLILLGGKGKFKKVVVNVMKEGSENSIRNLIKFMNCTPGLMRVMTPVKELPNKGTQPLAVALLDHIARLETDIHNKGAMLRRLVDGVTRPSVRVELIGKSSLQKVLSSPPLFSTDQFEFFSSTGGAAYGFFPGDD